MRDIDSTLVAVKGITPQVVNTGGGAVNTGNVDLRGYDGALVVFSIGANGGDTLSGTNKFTVLAQDASDAGSDTPGDYAAVDADDVVGVTPASGIVYTIDDAAEDDMVYQFAYVGGNRFLKVTVTPNGTLTNGNPVSVNIIKGLPHRVPAV
jgi:hypothetical protein